MSFPKYAAYKDSGIEWLGEVPAHWRIDRLKASIETCRNGIWGEEAQEDGNDIPCVRVADFDRRKLRVELSEPTIRNVTEKERNGRVLRRGDLLLEKSGGGEKQPVGCVVLYDDMRPAVCSNFVARMVLAPGQDPSYWRYVHAAAYAVRLPIGSINQTSGIQNLDQARYFNEPVAFPPKPEQAAIATFLDRETAKIDALVEEQRRLIELLKEKRQAVISQAVTKGLDPNVPMKDSGVEWLGKVPAHWEVLRLKIVAESIKAGPFGSSLTKDQYVESGFRVYGQEQVIPADFSIGDYYITAEKFEELRQYATHPGDILISCVGTFGKIALVPEGVEAGIINPRLLRLRVGPLASAEFLCTVLRSNVTFEQFALTSRGGTMDVINIGTLADILIAVPPLDEQRRIVTYVDAASIRFDTLAGQAETAISLLMERRSALISAAVTGKIDVRGLVPQPEVATA